MRSSKCLGNRPFDQWLGHSPVSFNWGMRHFFNSGFLKIFLNRTSFTHQGAYPLISWLETQGVHPAAVHRGLLLDLSVQLRILLLRRDRRRQSCHHRWHWPGDPLVRFCLCQRLKCIQTNLICSLLGPLLTCSFLLSPGYSQGLRYIWKHASNIFNLR